MAHRACAAATEGSAPMRLISTCLALSLGGLVAASLPAHAGDLSNDGAGGIREYGDGGIPAPMPQTYNETFKWYLRGDIGSAIKSTGTIGNDGLPVALIQPNDWRELSMVSFGFGRYVTPNFRIEYTLDYRPERPIDKGITTVSATETGRLPDTTMGVAATPAAQSATNTYTGLQNDSITYQNTTLLMSGFYDFNRNGIWHPYVGAGAGVAVHQLQMHGTTVYNCTGGTTTTTAYDGSLGPTTINSGCTTSATAPNLQTTFTTTTAANAIGYGLAAQVSAGLSYDLSQRVHWDTGYRMVWQSGHVSVASADGLSSIRINDIINHEVRTGVRWDLW
jgi:opacity protein-like surface antigen